MLRWFLCLFALLIFSGCIDIYNDSSNLDPTTLYVDTCVGSDSNDGLSWSTAKATIQSAVNSAKKGNTILVNDGTYAAFVAPSAKQLTIKSVNGALRTIVDGGNSTTPANLDPDNNERKSKRNILVGFTLQNGRSGPGGFGGSKHGVIINCIYRNNYGTGYGGSSCTSGSVVINCLAYDNTYGASWGGGVFANCLTINCTVVNNTGYGFWDGENYNAICYGNSQGVYRSSGLADNCHNCLTEKQRDSSKGNITGDPMFVDPDNHDYRLLPNSPCVDAGKDFTSEGWEELFYVETDFRGLPRLVGKVVDLGAYEYGADPVADLRAGEERKERERLEAERLAKEEAERKRLEEERLAKEEAERKERERLEAERRAKEEAERKERERLEAERKAKLDEFRRQKAAYVAAVLKRDQEIAAYRRSVAQQKRDKMIEEKTRELLKSEVEAYWAKEKATIKEQMRSASYSDICKAVKIGKGKAVVETFAETYMPRVDEAYEKAKERAMELEQVFESEFETIITNESRKYDVYCRCRDRYAEACADYRRKYKEMAHFYLLYKAGVLTNKELNDLDEQEVLVKFETLANFNRRYPIAEIIGEKESQFAAKFMPETYRLHQLCQKEYDETRLLYSELNSEMQNIGANDEPVLGFICEKGRDLAKVLSELTGDYESLYMQHRLGEKTAEELAEIDTRRAVGLKNFAEALATRVIDMAKAKEQEPIRLVHNLAESQIDPIESFIFEVDVNEDDFKCEVELPTISLDAQDALAIFVAQVESEFEYIPNRNFKMQKTEVTQAQWKTVMGNNPSQFKGDNRPVEMVSWNDAQEFIKRLNDMSKEVGFSVRYRLPTEEEWEYCCRAGSKGNWGKRENGQEGPLDVMGWYDRNSGGETHPVAKKEPNAWGLYDMHGNVWEWTSTASGSYRVNRGGGWISRGDGCEAGHRGWDSPGRRGSYLGFRLVAEDL